MSDVDFRITSTRRDVLKSLLLGSAAAVLPAEVPAASAHAVQGAGLERSNPEDVGVDPSSVLAFVEGANRTVGGLHSLMLVRHGKVAAEGWWTPYGPQFPHVLYSLSKSFTSTAVGLAASDGKLSVEDKVVSFFSNDLPANIGANLAQMRVKDLLTMSTGHNTDTTGPMRDETNGNWVRGFLSQPVEHKPGTKFVYNSGATYMLSAIVQKVTGRRVLDFLTPRLFRPLGIVGMTWERCPRGIDTGGWGLSVKTEDIARFGQLYLQNGAWKGRQILPESWVAEATSKQVSNGAGGASDWAQGYGYQFWRCRHGAFRGDGAFGQYCVVMPDQDAVLAITSGVRDMQAVLNLVWEHLLPGMNVTTPTADPNLKTRLSSLQVDAPQGMVTSPMAQRVSERTFKFDGNSQKLGSVLMKFDRNRCDITMTDDRGPRSFVCGQTSWSRGIMSPHNLTMYSYPTAKYAARGAWTSESAYEVRICYFETPYIETMRFVFTDNEVAISSKMNISFGPADRPTIVGRS